MGRLHGWLVIDKPYGIHASVGSVVGLLMATKAEAPLIQMNEALAVAGRVAFTRDAAIALRTWKASTALIKHSIRCDRSIWRR